ncbi:enoyl-ACP reductase FabI [Moraxella atlantae]|uniref:Enoyl-[acyl-carrier-protein] reductase [NADH] n=1 Tax=Faucicola atlantae TaxID=34059 RepID=A0A378Q3C5_9GAMM|nr:enoyl-ACP reductase [Moraxella atlantae]OPH35122.1 enoyl-ACP reductase [Moraxella atlantae]STY95016.1 Enoyl-[acyl-carrier-protein] reductase [NADH] FabI [Moraxella atlantae]
MLLQGKRFVVTGIASKLSIAWGIAEALHREGAALILTYPNDKIKKRVEMAAQAFGAERVLACDVSSDAQIAECFAQVAAHWSDGIDGVVHAIGFAPAEQLDGDFADVTTRDGFAIAHDISSYSLIALAKASRELLAKRQGSLLTLTYLGSTQVLPNYNVMGLAKASLEASVRYLASAMGAQGIRVNAISAGPIRTLAASGIKSFRKMLDANAKIAPLQRNVSIEEVGNAAVFLLSPWASGITGEILFVDGGFHTVALSESLLLADDSPADSTGSSASF